MTTTLRFSLGSAIAAIVLCRKQSSPGSRRIVTCCFWARSRPTNSNSHCLPIRPGSFQRLARCGGPPAVRKLAAERCSRVLCFARDPERQVRLDEVRQSFLYVLRRLIVDHDCLEAIDGRRVIAPADVPA